MWTPEKDLQQNQGVQGKRDGQHQLSMNYKLWGLKSQETTR